MIAVTFDYGQTICEIDFEMLGRRVAERGERLSIREVARTQSDAWLVYNQAKARGESHEIGWHEFMITLLTAGGISRDRAAPLAAWLWSEQPAKNLWRRPIAGMYELIRDLHALGTPLALISNSEGKLAELCQELGLTQYFPVLADSGLLGFEKPDRRIFEFTAERLEVSLENVIHVGDAWNADVIGAVEAGARAIWFSAEERELPARVERAADAEQLRARLAAWGVAGIVGRRP